MSDSEATDSFGAEKSGIGSGGCGSGALLQARQKGVKTLKGVPEPVAMSSGS